MLLQELLVVAFRCDRRIHLPNGTALDPTAPADDGRPFIVSLSRENFLQQHLSEVVKGHRDEIQVQITLEIEKLGEMCIFMKTLPRLF